MIGSKSKVPPNCISKSKLCQTERVAESPDFVVSGLKCRSVYMILIFLPHTYKINDVIFFTILMFELYGWNFKKNNNNWRLDIFQTCESLALYPPAFGRRRAVGDKCHQCCHGDLCNNNCNLGMVQHSYTFRSWVIHYFEGVKKWNKEK